jgi:hypothetical protein
MADAHIAGMQNYWRALTHVASDIEPEAMAGR